VNELFKASLSKKKIQLKLFLLERNRQIGKKGGGEEKKRKSR